MRACARRAEILPLPSSVLAECVFLNAARCLPLQLGDILRRVVAAELVADGPNACHVVYRFRGRN
jgi:hypothetical protein